MVRGRHRTAWSIKYQTAIAKLPFVREIEEFGFADTPVNEGLIQDLATHAFLDQQRNLVLIGGTGTGKIHLAVDIAPTCIRASARGRFFDVVDLVNKLKAESRNGRQGRMADLLCRVDFLVLDELGYLPFAQGTGQFISSLLSAPRGSLHFAVICGCKSTWTWVKLSPR